MSVILQRLENYIWKHSNVNIGKSNESIENDKKDFQIDTCIFLAGEKKNVLYEYRSACDPALFLGTNARNKNGMTEIYSGEDFGFGKGG